MTRTAQQVYWLKEAGVKDILVDLIDFYQQIYYVKILGYVVMSNHYHLCLEVSRPTFDIEDLRRRHEIAQSRLANPRQFQPEMANHFYARYTDLSMFMWEINRRMSWTYNRQKGTFGHLWGGRFKNVVIEDGQSILNVLAYIELNPVRAKLEKDPSNFPYSSVGRIKAELEQNLPAKAPAVSMLNRIPEAIRAKSYVEWIRYVASTQREPDLKRHPLPIQFTAHGWEIDMNGVYQALDTRGPSNWTKCIYGTTGFGKKALTEAGWLESAKGEKEVAPGGPSIAAA